MDIVVSVVGELLAQLLHCTSDQCCYIRHLNENLNLLKEEMDALTRFKEDVLQRVLIEESDSLHIRTENVDRWFKDVECVENKVDKILQRREQETWTRYLRGLLCHSKRLGDEIITTIQLERYLTSKGFDVVTERRPPPPSVEMPVENTFGMDPLLSEVWRHIEDPHVKIICLYGMGGVGKTTLLKKINNNFINNRYLFDIVIWVTVSKEVNLEDIQKVIAKNLGVTNEHSMSYEIRETLRRKKFVLLLDDIWEEIDLSELGIPSHRSGNSKIIFTTRSSTDLCIRMLTDISLRVECLSTEVALQLFLHKVTENRSEPLADEIIQFAKSVAEECKGLPLALKSIGSTMASRRKPEEWRHAVKALRNYPHKLSGLEGSVFHPLKFSYDNLSDTLKNCFLYCSMYPEDSVFRKDEVIELWIAEGFLNDNDTLDDSRDEGEFNIGSLIDACLLEGIGASVDYVKMHDVLRDMALWIASESKNKSLIYENDELFRNQGISRWEETVRLSLWSHNIKFLGETPICPRLLTFLARNTHLYEFPKGFFQSMQCLKVLDMRGNSYLRKFPVEVSELVNLEYLNLSDSPIEKLPIEVKNLTKLRVLLLDGTSSLKAVPGVIRSLSSLKVFSRLSTPFNKLYFHPFWETHLFEELECLAHIREIGLTLISRTNARHFASSLKLRSCVKRLIVQYQGMLSLDMSPSTTLSPGNFRELNDLCIENCQVKDLTCLIHAPHLRFVFVDRCPHLNEVIACDFASSSSEIQEVPKPFPYLKQLNFRDLPCLKSICRQVVLFPGLEGIYVRNCPNLRKLPFEDTNSASIMGDQEWWDQLEWDNEATKDALRSKFSSSSFRGPSYTYEATKFDLGDVVKATDLMMRAFEESSHIQTFGKKSTVKT